jgi:uncharacterized protein (TIGR00369 family)
VEARDFECEARVRKSFERQVVMETLGAKLTRVEPGKVDITLPFRHDLTQQHGYLHAGVIATILDSACGYAALSVADADSAVLAVEFKVNFLAPAIGDAIVARGRIAKAGRTLTVCTGEAYATSKDADKLVASMLSTIMNVRGRGIAD